MCVEDASAYSGPNVFYCDGPAGPGKAFTYTKTLRCVRKRGGIALAVAMGGIAAQLLDGGRTAHSRFKRPIPPPLEGANANTGIRSNLAAMLCRASLLVWDEAPTAPRAAFGAVSSII